jgi:raffinose/stachyose/melibiose transport system permease protein
VSDRIATPVAVTGTPPRLEAVQAAPRRRRRDYAGIGLWVALVVTSLLWFLPFFVMFLTSVKSNAEISATAPWSLPTSWAWENYAEAFDTGRLGTTGLNSLVISLVKVPLGLFVLGLIAIGSMVPIQIALGPLFATMLRLGALDSLPGLVLPYLAFGIPYAVFVLYGFFRAIPDEIEESARMDGASTFRVFMQVILPLAKPALAALFILDFVGTWNEYAMATTLLRSQDNWTVPLAVQSFSTQHGTDYGPLNAFIIMSAIPVLIVYLMFQRYFVQGALAGAVKG